MFAESDGTRVRPWTGEHAKAGAGSCSKRGPVASGGMGREFLN